MHPISLKVFFTFFIMECNSDDELAEIETISDQQIIASVIKPDVDSEDTKPDEEAIRV